MTHQDRGHYAMKHKNIEQDLRIAAALETGAITSENGKKTITCEELHLISKNLGITPKEVGIQADLMELRLKECQLGLFGYEPDGKNFNKKVELSDIQLADIQAIAPDGRTTCLKCWQAAQKLNISRIDVGSMCEKMGIKIKNCQLGAF
ncbi:MAG: hypothetical protein HQK74_08960 [Desulfamplus sp.]|nr:hypothetical protein [Desulfamplus sp.]